MKAVETIEEVRGAARAARAAGKTVGFVPTLGGMHGGHFSLIEAAKEACDFVVVSIFLNPTQFGPTEDLAKYPRTLEADLDACRQRGVDRVFAPSVETMYGDGGLTEVRVGKLTETLCGASRAGHFEGVCTICAKLFHIVQPEQAFFGEKDYQQVAVLRRMVRDLNFPLEIVVCPTVREPDGLPMSTRNQYLTRPQRRQAAELYQSLLLAERTIRRSQPSAGEVIEAVRRHLAEKAPEGTVEYVQIVDPETLQDVDSATGVVLVALAVKLGEARLIDHIVVDQSAAGA